MFFWALLYTWLWINGDYWHRYFFEIVRKGKSYFSRLSKDGKDGEEPAQWKEKFGKGSFQGVKKMHWVLDVMDIQLEVQQELNRLDLEIQI